MITNIIKRFFKRSYSPVRHLQKLAFASVGANNLLAQSSYSFHENERSFNGSIDIGSDCVFSGEVIFESDEGHFHLGDNCFVNCGTKFISRTSIRIGNHVMIAAGCTFYDHNSHSLNYEDRQRDLLTHSNNYKLGRPFIADKNWAVVKSREIVVEDDAWIGLGTVILPGVRIGRGAIVGAMSVVRADVEAWTVVAGNPAVTIKRLKQPTAR